MLARLRLSATRQAAALALSRAKAAAARRVLDLVLRIHRPCHHSHSGRAAAARGRRSLLVRGRRHSHTHRRPSRIRRPSRRIRRHRPSLRIHNPAAAARDRIQVEAAHGQAARPLP